MIACRVASPKENIFAGPWGLGRFWLRWAGLERAGQGMSVCLIPLLVAR